MLPRRKTGQHERGDIAGIGGAIHLHLRALRRRVNGQLPGDENGRCRLPLSISRFRRRDRLTYWSFGLGGLRLGLNGRGLNWGGRGYCPFLRCWLSTFGLGGGIRRSGGLSGVGVVVAVQTVNIDGDADADNND